MKLLRSLAFVVAAATAPLGAHIAAAEEANVVETAQAAGQFGTLLAAAKAAGLAQALATTNDITVFAPTDAAFEKLPAGTVETLLEPANRDQLAAILRYHVVPSRVPAADVPTDPTEVGTLNENANLTVVRDGESVTVGNARVVQADVMASNGVIHVIDTVLIPN